MNTKRHVLKRDRFTCSKHANQSKPNTSTRLEGPIWLVNGYENAHRIEKNRFLLGLDNEWDMHISSMNNEESGYDLDLNFLTISSQSRRSGLVGKNGTNHLKPIYVTRLELCVVWVHDFYRSVVAHPHLLVRATNERFLSTRATFKSVLASESHWLQPMLVLIVRWWPAPVSVGGL